MLTCADATAWLTVLERSSVDVAYIDPPFASGRLRAREGFAFDDRASPAETARSLIPVFDAIVRVLKPGGALWVQCDQSADWLLRAALEAQRGLRFENVVVWHYYNKITNARRKFAAAHDTLFLYSRTGAQLRFTPQEEPRERPVRFLKRERRGGRLANVKDENGRCAYIERTTRGVSDVWRIPALQPSSREWTGYPTQKPLALLFRVIASTSEPGALVIDPMCGSGTTLVAARELGRQWAGADASTAAVTVAARRLGVPMPVASAGGTAPPRTP